MSIIPKATISFPSIFALFFKEINYSFKQKKPQHITFQKSAPYASTLSTI